MSAIDTIREDWELCERCPLHCTRGSGSVVVGDGPERAQYMLIYDMPSKEDMLLGATMSSALDCSYLEIFEAGGLSRDLLFITPLVGCAPLIAVGETQSSQATTVVRPPKKHEITACMKRVHDLIYAVDPKLIFVAGELAFRELVPGINRLNATTLGKAAGLLYEARVPGKTRPLTYPVMAVMSAAAVQKNPSAAAHGPIGVTAKAIEDAVKYVEYVETRHG